MPRPRCYSRNMMLVHMMSWSYVRTVLLSSHRRKKRLRAVSVCSTCLSGTSCSTSWSLAPGQLDSRRRCMRRRKDCSHRRSMPIVRRSGRRERAHRELSRISDRHLGSGARRSCVRTGAEVRRGNADTRPGGVARLHQSGGTRWRVDSETQGWPYAAIAYRRGRERRALSPSRGSASLRVRRPRDLVLGVGIGSKAVHGRGNCNHRRRQFCRTSRRVPRQTCVQGSHVDTQPRSRGKHVPLSNRSDIGGGFES